MFEWLDSMPTPVVVFLGLMLGFAPYYPEPHIWEKLKMLAAGTLSRPLDIFDLFWHSLGFVLIGLKIYRDNFMQAS